MLEVCDVKAAYGGSPVLFGVSLNVGAGEVISLMGRNGMGKTTTLKSIMGILKPTDGSVRFEGTELIGRRIYRIARKGIGLVPEGRLVFSELTVKENLVATSRSNKGKPIWTLPAVYELFPRLQERASTYAKNLSGGEQQMLAIGRALMTNPKLLVLDEATEGLAPIVRAQIWRVLEMLKKREQAILIVDKNFKALTSLADRHYILEKGKVVWSGSSSEILKHRNEVYRYLGV